MIKAVIFDLDDTIYDYERINLIALEALKNYTILTTNITGEKFDEAYTFARKATKNDLKEMASGHNRMIYCQKTLEYLRINPVSIALEMYEVYWGTMINNMILNPGVMETLYFLRNAGIKIGICTDLTTHIQHRKLRTLGISDFVDAIVTSEEAGVEKPHRKMFDMIMEKLRVLPNECLFVGDSMTKDIVGACAVGMNAAWYQQKNISNSHNDDSSFCIIENIEEIKQIVLHLNMS